MIYWEQNEANNITLADAEAFCGQLRKVGLQVGPVHLNGFAGGANQTEIVPANSIATDPTGAYACVVRGAFDWHNVAMLKKMWGVGALADLQRVAAELGQNPTNAALNVPGAVAAIEELIRRAK